MRAEMVSEDVGAKENGAKVHVVQKYFLTRSRTTLWRKRL
jgi:hypothetical protein